MNKTLPALALAALLLATLPPALAGTAAAPEIDDGNDDVDVNGVCSGGFDPSDPCPSHDFIWPGADLDYAYVTDTDTALLLTMGLKSKDGFKTAGPIEAGLEVEYDYTFGFAVANVTYLATAHHHSGGAIEAGGVATAATTDAAGKELTLTVPKSAVGNVAKGAVLTQLYCQVDGEGSNNFKLGDRAPNANFGLDYTVANGTAAPTTTYATLTGATPTVSLAFAKPTTGTFVYNWTSPHANLTLDFDVKVAAGTLDVRVATASNQTLQQGTFTRNDAGSVAMANAAGPLTVTVRATGLNGTVALAFKATPPATGTTTAGPATHGFTFTPTPTTSATQTATGTTSKDSPAPGLLLALAAVGAAAVLLRRRLA